MKKISRFIAVLVAVLLAACQTKTAVPAWQEESSTSDQVAYWMNHEIIDVSREAPPEFALVLKALVEDNRDLRLMKKEQDSQIVHLTKQVEKFEASREAAELVRQENDALNTQLKEAVKQVAELKKETSLREKRIAKLEAIPAVQEQLLAEKIAAETVRQQRLAEEEEARQARLTKERARQQRWNDLLWCTDEMNDINEFRQDDELPSFCWDRMKEFGCNIRWDSYEKSFELYCN